MPSRNCKTRPIGWRIACNTQLAKAIKESGWLCSWVHTNIMASRDNLGRMEGGKHQLRDMFFPHFPEITPEEIEKIIKTLQKYGLIIHYKVDDMWFIQLPKIGNWSELVGNLSDTSDFPPPSIEDIQRWEQQFNEVYTPCIHRIDSVASKSKSKSKDKRENIYTPELSPQIKDLCDFWFLKRREVYNWNPPKATPQQHSEGFSQLLVFYELDQIKEAIGQFFATETEWLVENKHPFGAFLKGIERYCQNKTPKEIDKWTKKRIS